MKPGLRWPVGIVAVLLLSSAGQIWFATVASRDKSFAVEGDYYDKAAHWNDELAQRRENTRLGWRVEPTLQLGTGNGDGTLTIALRDSSGIPISGATVTVLAMHNARANRQLFATLTDLGAGEYRAAVRAQRPGEWELRFTITHGREHFSIRERVDVSGS
ncbi:MAG: FixH family protein [Gemmatimonadaceae bacterium]